jgi:hypothetical protein
MSATGSLTGKATTNQVFTTNGGTVTCTTATTSGQMTTTGDTLQQHATVKYSGCTGFGFVSPDISDATYKFTAGTGKNVHIKNTITITPKPSASRPVR